MKWLLVCVLLAASARATVPGQGGFHQTLTYKLDASCATRCTWHVHQLLGRGAFVDPFEVVELATFGGATVHVIGRADLEAPALAAPSSSFLASATGVNVISVPIHLRYQAAAVERNSSVSISLRPAVMWLEQEATWGQYGNCEPVRRLLPVPSTFVVPVGSMKVQALVRTATFGIALLSVVAVLCTMHVSPS